MVRRRQSTIWVVALILLPLLTVITQELGLDPAPTVEAATDCTLDSSDTAPDWGIAVQKEVFDDDGDRYNNGGENDFYIDGPEDSRGHHLDTLVEGFHTSFLLLNDSAVSIRMNLTTGWKYTFCVDFQPEFGGANQATPLADVYLLQEMDQDRYEWDYRTRYQDWDGFRDDIANSPPWMQNAIFWHPFRDVHAYELVDEVEFAVALDHEERSADPWSDSVSWNTMFLMIDSWDNIREYDAGIQNRNFTVDLTVMVEERYALPNWTVTLVCCGGLMGILAAPFLIHHRYMKAGLDPMQTADLMPHLETAAEVPVAADVPPPQY